jgi:hypothetical protein
MGFNTITEETAMTPLEVVYFAITLFLALVFLLLWKRRRDLIAERLSRNLRGYITKAEPAPIQPDQPAEKPEDEIINVRVA